MEAMMGFENKISLLWYRDHGNPRGARFRKSDILMGLKQKERELELGFEVSFHMLVLWWLSTTSHTGLASQLKCALIQGVLLIVLELNDQKKKLSAPNM